MPPYRGYEVDVVQKLFFSVRKGSCGNFVLSTALLVLSTSVVHCMVIAQSSHIIIVGVCP